MAHVIDLFAKCHSSHDFFKSVEEHGCNTSAVKITSILSSIKREYWLFLHK